MLGAPPNCIGCGECYDNWTRLIDEVMSSIDKEDVRLADLLHEHYDNVSPEQLQLNITALQRVLDSISNFSIDTMSLNASVSQLRASLDAVSVKDFTCLPLFIILWSVRLQPIWS